MGMTGIVQQPSLRSFIVCERLPQGCVAYPVTDGQNEPHLRPGDLAIIDPTDRQPAVGELFVIEWQSGGTDIVETWTTALRAGSGPHGEMIDTVCWKVGGACRPRSYDEMIAWLEAGRCGGWVDGPFATEGPRAGVLEKKLRGRVVGILKPEFSEALRLSSPEDC
jgi:hypothetical protein